MIRKRFYLALKAMNHKITAKHILKALFLPILGLITILFIVIFKKYF